MDSNGHRGWTGSKAIPEQRDRQQSQLLVWLVGTLLVVPSVPIVGLALVTGKNAGAECRLATVIAVAFGVLVWRVRAATLPAALCGSAVCLLVTMSHPDSRGSVLHSGLLPLATLFLLTFAATRIARMRGVRSEAAETRKGRRASQVIANLGWAGLLTYLDLFAFEPGLHASSGVIRHALRTTGVLLTAVLAEATADTVASEIGQAYGGTPLLVGSWRRVEPGTDGAITIVGTLAGSVGALVVVLVGLWALQFQAAQAAIALVAAVAGLFFDTFLGASLERRGWLGNDLVNFASVGFAGLVAWLLLLLPIR